MKFVIDMMGGDNSLKASIPALKKYLSINNDAFIFCVGDESLIDEFKNEKRVKVILSKTIIKMDANPLEAYRDNESSLMVAMNTFIENSCDALISAGSSGALLTASIFKIKRLKNISRPAFITSFPTIKENKKFVLCDLGANNSNTKEELHQFAKMGSIYYEILYKDEFPKIHLLSNGTEEGKGSPLTKEAYELLKNDSKLNFIGNTEGRDALFGDLDVIVADGFSGNIFLKSTEGTSKAFKFMLKEAFTSSIKSKIGYLLCKKGINNIAKKMDYKNVGGALLVGVNGVVIKAHGNSDEQSFLSSLKIAENLVKADIINKFKEKLDDEQ
ncbi:MAG: phosphate acyltransferase PlsX [Bacillales bacterium]